MYEALIKGLNSDVEEEITIQVNNIVLNCFVTQWGFSDVVLNKNYKVDIGATIFDDVVIEKKDVPCGFNQIDNSFGYMLSGRFCFDTYRMDCGIIIELDKNEVDLSDYAYLDNQNIVLQVDRITVEFVD